MEAKLKLTGLQATGKGLGLGRGGIDLGHR